MRFMMMVKGSDAVALREDTVVADMVTFHDAMVRAGVLRAVEALESTSPGAQVRFVGGRRTVAQDPFDAAQERIMGFWLVEVSSLDEALAWARRVPLVDGEVELRQVACQLLPAVGGQSVLA